MVDKYISVSALTKYIKYKIDNDLNLNNVFLKGEISNFKKHSTGHFYFTIKDETSRINAIMFANKSSVLKFLPMDGMKVLVTGKISVYEANGGYQIYVDTLTEDGIGNLSIAYEQLKNKLQLEGLFDESKKKQIPKIPMTIGIITASSGAAIKDVLTTLNRRWPLAKTILFPSLVQGSQAKDDIVKNIKLANTFNLDVIILTRGGGSIEDLWAFNEEIVARSIFDSKIPIISAVGHEIDFTISDFVADLRAPTPTSAAEIAALNKLDIDNAIKGYTIRLNKVIINKINLLKEKLNNIQNNYIIKNPMTFWKNYTLKLDSLIERLNINLLNLIKMKKERLNRVQNNYILNNPHILLKDKINKYNKLINSLKVNIINNINYNQNSFIKLINKLEILNPLNTLKRGYSIVKLKDKVITQVKDLKKDDIINLSLQDGCIQAKVE
ncbi:MAG: exodeoxyribonuclease VII large subunit [Bacilli bacterium]